GRLCHLGRARRVLFPPAAWRASRTERARAWRAGPATPAGARHLSAGSERGRAQRSEWRVSAPDHAGGDGQRHAEVQPGHGARVGHRPAKRRAGRGVPVIFYNESFNPVGQTVTDADGLARVEIPRLRDLYATL